MDIRPLTRKTVALIKSAVRNITIEPCFFLFAMNYGFYIVVARALYINKVNIICSYKLKEYVYLLKNYVSIIFLCPIQICAVNMNISKDICDTIQHHKEIQVEVQKYASELSAYNEIIQGKGKMYAIKHHYEII